MNGTNAQSHSEQRFWYSFSHFAINHLDRNNVNIRRLTAWSHVRYFGREIFFYSQMCLSSSLLLLVGQPCALLQDFSFASIISSMVLVKMHFRKQQHYLSKHFKPYFFVIVWRFFCLFFPLVRQMVWVMDWGIVIATIQGVSLLRKNR